MKKETRNNLIFLGLFLAISLPGAVMLFLKKLDPEAKAMYLPSATPHEAAYMHPISVPGKVKRIVPVGAAAWTAELREQFFPGTTPPTRDVPPTSRGQFIELLAVTDTDLGLLLWNGAADVEGGDVLGQPEVPEALVESMKDAGYPVPPKRVSVVRVSRQGGASVELQFGGRVDTIDLPPSLVTQARAEADVVGDRR